MSEVVVDVSEVHALAAALRAGSVETAIKTRAVVAKGALNVKRDWQRQWSGLSHAPLLARAVTYDTWYGTGTIEAEIGPDKDRPQGALGNLIEYGSAKNGPKPGGTPAALREMPRFETAIERLAAGLLT